MKKIVSLLVLVCMLLSFFVSCKGEEEISEEEAKYNEALGLIDAGDIEGAYEMLKALEDYETAEKLLGRFRYVMTSMSWIEYDTEENKESEKIVITFTLNENGFPTKVVSKNSYNGELVETVCAFSYESKGNLIQTMISYDGEKSISDLSYDSKGNLIQEICTDSDGDKTIYDYTYDSKGNKTKYTYTSANGNKTIHEYMYDEKGNITKEVSSSGTSIYTTEYTYDINGNKIKKVYTDSYGDKSVTDYTYDTKGNLIKESGENYVDDYNYDTKGNLIKRVYTGPKYDYDTNQTVTRKTVYDYIHDEHGNVIKVVWTGEGYSGTAVASYKIVYIPFDISERLEELLEVFNLGGLV